MYQVSCIVTFSKNSVSHTESAFCPEEAIMVLETFQTAFAKHPVQMPPNYKERVYELKQGKSYMLYSKEFSLIVKCL